MSVVNLTNQAWQIFNLDYLDKTYGLEQNWDGIFYDLVDARASLYNQRGIDINNDGRADSAWQVDTQWQAAMTHWLEASRQRWPGKLIVINGNSLADYQAPINGRMFENFPTPWEGAGTWADSMKQYLAKLPALNQAPQTYLINAVYQPKDNRNFYAQMRFGLTSALLGDGYFSFDNGESGHNTTWWFDEYNVKLGLSQGSAVNLLYPQTKTITAGVWRRDFANGIVLVNSTRQIHYLSLPDGEFKRLRGWQDPAINTGQAIKELTLCPMSGIILLRQGTDQPVLTGTYLMSYDWAAARQPGSWWEEIRGQFKRFLVKLNLWFKYYYYGQHKN